MEARPKTTAIVKELSANDTGETGSHQAGILVPRLGEVLAFFPRLGTNEQNPRRHLVFYDDQDRRWEFAFIYYNNSFFGGTRNEYRLTRMTSFIRTHGLKVGDSLRLSREPETGRLRVGFRRMNPSTRTRTGVLKLGSSWRVIEI